MDTPRKPQLHSSHFSMLTRCGEKFRRVVIEGQREPQTVPLIIGIASHQVIAKNLTHKVETGALMPDEAVKDFARDAFNHQWDSGPVMLNAEEVADGLGKTKGGGADLTISLTTLHHKQLAPSLYPEPGGIEQPWVIQCDGYPYDLAGMWDVRERFTVTPDLTPPYDVRRIRDTKTRNKAMSQGEADTSEQFTMYGLADMLIHGKGAPADSMHMDVLVKPTKTLPARVLSLETKRNTEDFTIFKARFERFIQVIEAGAFTPASQSDWWCATAWCGFAADGSCPFFSSRKTVIPVAPTPEPAKPKNRKTIAMVAPGSDAWKEAIGA